MRCLADKMMYSASPPPETIRLRKQGVYQHPRLAPLTRGKRQEVEQMLSERMAGLGKDLKRASSCPNLAVFFSLLVFSISTC